ncbi:MAG: CdaR family protein [Oscillospiraceae bacterium]
MKKLLARDGFLKIFSVLIAIIIWIYIIIVLDPTIEVTVRDVPVQFVGQEVLATNGLSVVSESATTVTMKVKGSRKKMGSNDMKNIIAKVDLAEINKEGTQTLPVEVVVPFENSGVSSKTPYSIDVLTEKYVEKKIGVQVVTTGHLAPNFMPGNINIEPKEITLKGAESVVGKVSKAVVGFDYSTADVDIDVDSPIKLYGIDGKEILSRDALTGRMQKSADVAKIHCPVLKLKKVGIELDFGTTTLSPDMSKYRTEPNQISIYGDNGVTADINSIKTEPILLDKFKDKEKIKVKLQVPPGVKVMDDILEVEVIANNNK